MFCPLPSFWGPKDLAPPPSHQEYLVTKSTSSTSLDVSTPAPRKSLVPGTALTVPPTPDTATAATTEESSASGSVCNSLPEAASASIGSGSTSTNAKSAPIASSEVASPQRPRILEFNQKLEEIERLKEAQKEETEKKPPVSSETTTSKDQTRSDIDNVQDQDDEYDDAKKYEEAAISPLSFVLLAMVVALVYSYQSGNLPYQLDGVSSRLVQHAPSALSSLVVSDPAPATALGSNSTTSTLTLSPPPLDTIFQEAPKPSSILASAASSAKTATQKLLAEVAESAGKVTTPSTIVEDAVAANNNNKNNKPVERQLVVVPKPVSKPVPKAKAKATPRANTEAQTTSDATSHGAASVLWSYLPGTTPPPAPAPEPVQFFPLFAGLDRFLLENAKKTRTGLKTGLDDLTENVRKHKEWRLVRRKKHHDEVNHQRRGRKMGNLWA